MKTEYFRNIATTIFGAPITPGFFCHRMIRALQIFGTDGTIHILNQKFSQGHAMRHDDFSREFRSSVEPHCTMKTEDTKIVELTDMAASLIIKSAGEDLGREGLSKTPRRFSKAMSHLTSGYRATVEDVVGEGIFSAEGSGLVCVKDIEFYSLCEHHMLPFWGAASVAYYPHKKIVGLSKIPRIVNLFARRLQVQERITEQVADALIKLLDPRAVMVRIEAQHLCMMMRGVEKQNSRTTTESSRGTEHISVIERERLFASFSK